MNKKVEREISQLMNRGLSDRQIAKRLGVRRKRVIEYKNAIYVNLTRQFPVWTLLVISDPEFKRRWSQGSKCPYCGNDTIVQQRFSSPKHKYSFIMNGLTNLFYGCERCRRAESCNKPITLY